MSSRRWNDLRRSVCQRICRIRQFLSDWSVADKVILCLSTVVLCVAIAEWVADPPHTAVGVVLAALLCVALALLPWRGRMAAWMVLVIGVVGDAYVGVDFNGPNETWALLLAMVILGRRARIMECIASLGVTIGSMAYTTIRYPEIMGYSVPSGIANFGVGLLCAYLAGVSIRYREKQRIQQDMQQQLERALLRLLVSTSLHDSVSGSLTRISVAAERVKREHPVAYTCCGMEEIAGFAADALRETHRAIDMIHGDSSALKETGQFALLPAVQAIAVSNDRRLHELGYGGESVVQGECDRRLDDRGYVFVALLREIYTNIERHCDPGCSGYRVRIRFARDSVTLSQTNGLKTSARWIEPPKSKRGLLLHNEQIKAFGGTVHASADNQRWRYFCVLPLPA